MVQFWDAAIGLYARPQREAGAAGDGHAGQGLVEYGLLLLFLATAVIVALVFFGDRLAVVYSKIGDSVPN